MAGVDPAPNQPPYSFFEAQGRHFPHRFAVQLNIALEHPEKKVALFGSADRHLRMIRDTFGVQVISRDDQLRVSGDSEQVNKAAAVLEQLQKTLRRQDWLSVEDVGK